MKKSVSLAVGLLSLLLLARASWAQAPAPTAPPPSNPPPSLVQPANTGTSAGEKGISVWAILPWRGIGAGARYMLPLPITSLLTHTSLHDSWALEFGADFYHWDCGIANYSCSWNEILPVVGMMWKVDLTPQFTVYPKIEAGYPIGWYSGPGFTGRESFASFYVSGGAGLLYKLSNGLTLRAEASSYDIKGGVGWLF
ncbi:MAG TPA: hypothetical protein VGL59_14960 [Polyangia bacterium]